MEVLPLKRVVVAARASRWWQATSKRKVLERGHEGHPIREGAGRDAGVELRLGHLPTLQAHLVERLLTAAQLADDAVDVVGDLGDRLGELPRERSGLGREDEGLRAAMLLFKVVENSIHVHLGVQQLHALQSAPKVCDRREGSQVERRRHLRNSIDGVTCENNSYEGRLMRISGCKRSITCGCMFLQACMIGWRARLVFRRLSACARNI